MSDNGIGWSATPRGRAAAGDGRALGCGADLEQGAESGQGLSDHTQKRLGIHLRAMYDTIVQQPVPDRFRDLIARLEASEDPGDGRR